VKQALPKYMHGFGLIIRWVKPPTHGV